MTNLCYKVTTNERLYYSVCLFIVNSRSMTSISVARTCDHVTIDAVRDEYILVVIRDYRKGKGKGKSRYSSSWGIPTSELRDVTCHMGSQCYLPPYARELAPPNSSNASWYSIYLPRRDGRLS